MLMRRLGAGLMLTAAVLAAGCTHSTCNRAPCGPTVTGSVPVAPAAPCPSCGTGAVPGAVPATTYSPPVAVTPAPSGGLFHH